MLQRIKYGEIPLEEYTHQDKFESIVIPGVEPDEESSNNYLYRQVKQANTPKNAEGYNERAAEMFSD